MKHRGPQRLPWKREDRLPTPDELDWLRSPQGRGVCAEMAGGQPADTPAAVARWRQRLEADKVAAAWGQVLLRKTARAKFSRADDMLFDRVGLEQATDEVVAMYKARRFAGSGRVADLCCGIGGDTLALATATDVLAVDFSPLRVAMAEHNAAIYGGSISTLADDVTFARPDADAVHIDPDRRPDGLRRHDPVFSSPALDVLHEIACHYGHYAIKLSPGVDFSQLALDAEIELISHNGECKQAVVWTGRFKQAHRRATALPGGESIWATRSEELDWPAPTAVEPGQVLYEPDPAVIRADLVGLLARKHDLHPVDEQIAYLVGPHVIQSDLLTPFRVIDVAEWSVRKARSWLADHDVGRLDIKTRGFAARPEDIQRRLSLKGKRQAVLFLTRIGEKPLAILADRAAL